MKSREIRQTFIDYFNRNGHQSVSSSSLVPENDPTLLFANAGMNQFKNAFLGLEQRSYKRAVTSQKCVRAGGKHNDLENVGHTARHHTFFEMLGNFSFGDYFKKEAIHYAWELLTKDLQIPADKLYVTVFEKDDEAADIWHKQEGVARDRIYRFGEKDNFWRMGDTGPCGPCSEIFYDHGPEADIGRPTPSVMGGDGDRYVEIWNLVFMQFNEDENGMTPLPKPSVDTGGGLERWASVMQKTANNYDTDVFLPIIHKASQISGRDYNTDKELVRLKGGAQKEAQSTTAAMRVVADHSRATAFLIADGVLPSNEGRGYVLRRIMRRAIRYGRKFTDNPDLLKQTVAVVIEEMKTFYPELERQRSLILTTVSDEVARFLTTLDQGTEILNASLEKLAGQGQKTLAGELVFKLYDTFGFPVDLTRLMAEEKGFLVDEQGFEKQMSSAREKAKSSWKGKALSGDATHLVQLSHATLEKHGATHFEGYHSTHLEAPLLVLSNGFAEAKTLKAGDSGIMIFADTCFYAESGGQVGDHGYVKTKAGACAEVLDCTKQNDIFLHHVKVEEGTFTSGDLCEMQITDSSRRATAANHSATHLLHSALRSVLGSHVTQAGSLVDPIRLRFDFTHNKPLTTGEIDKLETMVNEQISRATDVMVTESSYQEALDGGAMALFGEKYGDSVRVIKMADFSTELCGGTHVTNTAMIRLFKIVSEGGVSSGVRRIEALTGDRAFEFLDKNTRENSVARAAVGDQDSWTLFLSDERTPSVLNWIEQARTTIKGLEREIKSLKGAKVDVDALVATATDFAIKGINARLVIAHLELEDRNVLSELTDKIKSKIQSGVVVLVGKGDKAHPIVVGVSKDLTKELNAGKILGMVAAELGGKGGGRPDFAQGAAPDLSKIEILKGTWLLSRMQSV